MKKTEIAAKVFEAMDPVPLSEIHGGDLVVPVTDLAGLSLIPWFCDASVQWALRIALPGKVLNKSLLKKVNDSFIAAAEDGSVLVGIPGNGIEPSTFTLFPLADAVANVVQPGMSLELAAANLGVVKRDWDARAETSTTHGNQRYVGAIDAQGRWAIGRSTPALTVAELDAALACGRMVAMDGPWTVKDKSHASAVVMEWLRSPQANVNPMAVKAFVTLKDGAFTNSDPGMVRKLCGLGLGFFRHQLEGGPFHWEDSGPPRNTQQELEEVARTVVG